jgi:hypothetical protein
MCCRHVGFVCVSAGFFGLYVSAVYWRMSVRQYLMCMAVVM